MKFSFENLENALPDELYIDLLFLYSLSSSTGRVRKNRTIRPFVTKLDESESKVNLGQCPLYIQWFVEVCNSASLE